MASETATRTVNSPELQRLVDSTVMPLGECGPYLRIFKSNVFVRDHDLSLEFYVGQLGFSVVADIHFEFGGRWVAVAPPDGSAILALIAPKRGSENYKLIGRNTQIAFIAEDINVTFERWRSRGVRFGHFPQKTLFGGTSASFYDLDGNCFELLASDEFSREIEAQRRAIAQKLEADRSAAQELEIAKQVQARLFPQTLPRLKTLDYAGICVQARQIGGDYYDFLDLGRERLALVIGDIAGKGIAAALVMANLQASLRSQCAIARDELERFLGLVNRMLFENTTAAAYATLFFAEYDDRTRQLRYVNCGHLCALLLHADGTVDRLDSTSTVMGLFEEWECSIGSCQLRLGDMLALYTDGITESFNESGEEFGEERLVEALSRHRDLASKELVAAVVNEVKNFSLEDQFDDNTVIVAKCRLTA